MSRPSLMPTDTPDYMADAWAGCIVWAISNDAILASFRADTGNKWKPAQNSLEVMIDEASGAGDAFCKAFVEWANVHVWGPIGGPAFMDDDETCDAVLS